MTALLAPPPDNRLWSSMPGWGIVADLTPPELIAARQLRVLRKLIFAGLALVLVVCAGGYALAVQKHSSAKDERDSITARTAQLQTQLNTPAYKKVITMQGTVAKVQGQVALLMKNDVDLPLLLARVRDALPAHMAITSLSVTLNTASTVTAPGAPATGLDTSGNPIIGTVTVAGVALSLDDLPTFVDRLAALNGVVNLVPTSNAKAGVSAEFSLTFAVSNKLYTHRYDAAQTGGK